MESEAEEIVALQQEIQPPRLVSIWRQIRLFVTIVVIGYSVASMFLSSTLPRPAYLPAPDYVIVSDAPAECNLPPDMSAYPRPAMGFWPPAAGPIHDGASTLC